MLIKIDDELYLNLDHITMLERDPGGVVIRFAGHATDAFDGPRAQRIIDALDGRQPLLVRLDGWLRRVLKIDYLKAPSDYFKRRQSKRLVID